MVSFNPRVRELALMLVMSLCMCCALQAQTPDHIITPAEPAGTCEQLKLKRVKWNYTVVRPQSNIGQVCSVRVVLQQLVTQAVYYPPLNPNGAGLWVTNEVWRDLKTSSWYNPMQNGTINGSLENNVIDGHGRYGIFRLKYEWRVNPNGEAQDYGSSASMVVYCGDTAPVNPSPILIMLGDD